MGWWYTFAIEHDWLFQPCYYLDEVADSLAFLSIVEFGWWCFHWGEHGSMYEQQLFSTAILEELASYIQSLDCEVCKERYANEPSLIVCVTGTSLSHWEDPNISCTTCGQYSHLLLFGMISSSSCWLGDGWFVYSCCQRSLLQVYSHTKR